jgi:8-oxo-dGTP pyrophosphatase MutT (NUDIX family)
LHASNHGSNQASSSSHLQACAVPYRREGGTISYLVITSSGGSRWIFPKGIVEDGGAPLDTACTEAFEEAGVKGSATPEPMSRYRRRKWGKTWEVWVYPLACEELNGVWPEKWRRRRWVSYEEARSILSPQLRRILGAVHTALSAPTGAGPHSAGEVLDDSGR